MTNNIIIHIGLPKTATTSIQKSIFQNYDSNAIYYLGVFQPRSIEQKADYHLVTHAIDCDESQSIQAIAVARSVFETLISKFPSSDLLISEEEITVDGPLTNWQQKLKRLGEIIKYFDYKILVTVREPVSASYSLYCELFPQIKNKFPDFMSFYEKSNSARIYHYDELLKQLFSIFDRKNVYFVQFELLKDGNSFISSINNITGCNCSDMDSLKNHNKKNIGSEGCVTKPKNLGHFAVSIRRSKLGNIFIKTPVLKYVIKVIYNRIKFISFSSNGAEVPFLDEKQRKLLSKEFTQGNKALFKETGIEYLKY